MDYKQFLNTIVKELESFYGPEAVIEVKDILQNNNVHKDGLLITFTRGKETVSPVIYLGSIFESLSDGSKTIDECVGVIAAIRKEFEADSRLNSMAEGLLHWECVKDSIYPALISVSENKELLKNLAYTPFLDLATVYIIRREYTGIGNTSIKITNTILNAYGIEKSGLHMQAMANMEKDGYEMEDMMELLYKTVPEADRDKLPDISGLEAGRMYVLTNSQKLYGAAALLDSKLLARSLGSMTSFILPSSIHETIFVPISDEMDTESLNGIIREVNGTQLDASERLSDHYYLYDGKSKSVKMCA